MGASPRAQQQIEFQSNLGAAESANVRRGSSRVRAWIEIGKQVGVGPKGALRRI